MPISDIRIKKHLMQNHRNSRNSDRNHGFKASLAWLLVPMLSLLLLCSTVGADPQLCPVTYAYYEGQHVSLSAAPYADEYSYDWTPSPGITRESGTDPWVFSFIMPDYDPSGTNSYAITVDIYPTGAPLSCKDTCEITVIAMERANFGNFVWEDLNYNGIQDPGEPGIDGVTVRLLDQNGNLLTSTTTANGGYYSFPGLLPGKYMVAIVHLLATSSPLMTWDRMMVWIAI